MTELSTDHKLMIMEMAVKQSQHYLNKDFEENYKTMLKLITEANPEINDG